MSATVRLILWFVSASILTTSVHEFTHACVAYALGVPSTLFSYFVNVHWPSGDRDIRWRALVGISGPLSSLVLGAAAWLIYRSTRTSAAGVPLLFLAVFGVGTFFGNLMSIALVGDFSNVARLLGLPMAARQGLAVAGGLVLAAIHFWAGRELVQWAPASASKMSAMLRVVAVPVLVGTAAVIVLNQPMPSSFASTRIAEATFWAFAAIGALTLKKSDLPRGRLTLGWADVAVLFLAVSYVRLTVAGIPFTP